MRKTMEHDELKRELIEHYKDEVNDVHEYVRLSKEADAAGEEHTASCLYEIATEEYKHAHILRNHLETEYNYDPLSDKETEKKWKEIKYL